MLLAGTPRGTRSLLRLVVVVVVVVLSGSTGRGLALGIRFWCFVRPPAPALADLASGYGSAWNSATATPPLGSTATGRYLVLLGTLDTDAP